MERRRGLPRRDELFIAYATKDNAATLVENFQSNGEINVRAIRGAWRFDKIPLPLLSPRFWTARTIVARIPEEDSTVFSINKTRSKRR